VAEQKDTILVIDHDADERATLAEATLEPFGYIVRQCATGEEGLKLMRAEGPDVLILDLHLEGLSGRDVLTAINAQAYDVPVILLANEGAEKSALQAFRLGAKDYVLRPIREAELIQSVERALKEVRLKRDRETLIGEVQRRAEDVQRHLNETKTLVAIGKAVSGLRNLNEIFDSVIRASVQLTKAEVAGFFLKDDQTGGLILRAGHNLSRSLQDRMGQPVEDDLAALVMTSRDTYLADGEGLKRFHPAQENVSAVIYAPLVVHESAIGLLWVANTRIPFEAYMKDLLTALADYAAIAVVNARLFTTMQERTQQLEQMAKQAPQPAADTAARPTSHLAVQLAAKLRAPLTSLLGNMNMFRTGEMGRLTTAHQAAVDVMHRQLEDLIRLIDNIVPPNTGDL
jgi:two-component system NtrC family sensor kinase